MADFIDWLQIQHDKIMGLEKDAYDLMRKDDIAGYKKHMKEKAVLLSQLAEEAEPQLAEISRASAWEARSTLGDFSANASTALKLDSVFYMSSLLYKDEHPKGDPDNLQVLIDELKRREKRK